MRLVASVRLPAFCPNCGAVFPSSLFIPSGGSGTIRYNAEVCPRCGGMAQIANATYRTVAGEVLATIQAPGVSRPMLIAFGVAVSKAIKENKQPEALVAEVAQINPSFAALVLKLIAAAGANWLAILAFIVSIVSFRINLSLDAKVDVNQLFDQWMNTPPRVAAPPEPPAPESEPPDRPEMEPSQDEPPP
jgi:ribosomal protein S27AE